MTQILSDSFSDAETASVAESSTDSFSGLTDFKKKHYDKLIFAHLNVNSIRYKMQEVAMILQSVDILGLTETKLDSSFPTSQFKIENFVIYRNDRNCHGGGVMFFENNAIPSRIRNDLCSAITQVESLVLEIIIKSEKIFVILLYKPPKANDSSLASVISETLDKCMLESKCFYIIGDFNINLCLHPNALSDIFDCYNLTNVIKEPTCFKSVSNPTLIDPIVTNNARRLGGSLNLCIGVSDFHNIVCAATRIQCPKFSPHMITYRSYKNFDDEKFVEDLYNAPFHVSKMFDDVDDMMWFHNQLLSDIIETHAPSKKKLIKRKQVPYMNGLLRKAINVKAMLRRKFIKFKTQSSWSRYKTQRNQVSALKRTSMKKYFEERCSKSRNVSDFWKTITPFMSDKNAMSGCMITLYEDDKVVTNQENVANILNDYFINITKNMSEPDHVSTMETADLLDHYSVHPSINCIQTYVSQHSFNTFSFAAVTNCQVMTKLKALKCNKAQGYDRIPAKLLKIGANAISPSLCYIMNCSFEQNVFPSRLKHVEIVPLHKKNDNLNKANYRPVSVLISLSKLVEGLMCDQLMSFFENVLCKELSAYRKNYGCSNVLLHCVEEWKYALDNGNTIGCIMMDLSKAFDSIPHGLIIAKLAAYGVSKKSCDFIRNYLSERRQRVKLTTCKSNWSSIERGVPQGSLTGPVLFNVFLNDLLLMLKEKCQIYNYADDNTLAYIHKDPSIVKINLECVSHSALQWFHYNYMEANPSKFQSIVFSGSKTDISFCIDGNVIQPANCVKLLGVYLDDQLSFNHHIKELTLKCARQISAMGRLSKVLNNSCKLQILDAFILSNFSYCATIYHFCNVSDSRKMEKLLERALRYVYLDFESTYSMLLQKANKKTLYLSRLKELLLSVFKIRNNLMPPIESSFFTKQLTPYDMRYVCLRKPVYHTIKYGFKSLRYQGATLFNNLKLDNDIYDFNAFKSLIKMWSPQCNCNSCILCSVK